MDERRRNIVLILGLYMFSYMIVKHVVAIHALILQGESEKFANLSLINKIIGRRERSIWSHECLARFVERLLLGSWTEK
jgi:hypothetical protein